MSDAVMVPRADPDAIWLEPSCCADPSHGRTWSEDLCFPVCEDGREPVKYIRADLAASTPVGGWERTDIQRMMDPVRAYLVDKYVRQRVAEEASERAVDVMYRALAAPPPVSTGSRPQEAVPSEQAEPAVVDHMVQRFLSWRLPEGFNPDNGISFKPTFNDHMEGGPMWCNPSGTNLFNYDQAKAMVLHMLEGLDK